MARRAGARLILALAAFALCAELLGLAAYYIETGALFYGHGRRPAAEPLAAPADRVAVDEALHPYFGFTHAPGTRFDIPDTLRAPGEAAPPLRTNNFGFVSPVDYPVARTGANQYFVGVFGGSVGLWFCQLGLERLVERLAAQPAFAGRDIVPLCFSHEGYKQPQQVLVLTYLMALGQPLDLGLNIDGFNDVALARLNRDRGLHISMPSAQHLDPLVNLVVQSTLTPDKVQSLASILRDRETLVALQRRRQAARSAAIHFVLDRTYRRIDRRYVRELGRFATLPSNPAGNAVIQVTKAPPALATYDDMARLWSDASLRMHDLLAARGARYIHVLQPNQYFSARRFSAGEAAVALNPATPYRESVEQGYPALRARADAVLKGAIQFVDATTALDEEPSAMYVDDCCHYTLAGNQRLADVIAAAIAQAEPSGPSR